VAELVGFRLDALDDVRRLELGLVLDSADQLALGLFDRQAGDLLELVPLFLDETSEVRLVLLQAALAIVDGLIAPLNLGHAAVDLLGLLVERLFLLLDALLDDLDLVTPLLGLAVEVRAHLQKRLFGLEVRFLHLVFGRLARVLDDPLGRTAGLIDLRSGPLAINGTPHQSEYDRPGKADQNCNCYVHFASPSGGLRAGGKSEPRLSRVRCSA